MCRVIICGWMMFGLVVIAAAQMPKAEPKLTPEQVEKLKEREPLLAKVISFMEEKKPKEAADVFKKILEIEQNILGETHPALSDTTERMAMLYEIANDFSEAKKAWERLLSIREKYLGKEHWQTVDAKLAVQKTEVIVNLSERQRNRLVEVKGLNVEWITLFRKGMYSEAATIAEKVLRIKGEVLGKLHPEYAISLNNLAASYKSLAQFADAKQLYVEALRIRKEILGVKHPDYATSLHNIGALHMSLAQYSKAEPYMVDALQITKEALGEMHPSHAQSLNNLATLYQSQGHSAKAKPLYVEALRIRKEILGDKHPDYANSLNNLAMFYISQGQYSSAEAFLVEALRINKEVLGEKHPDYAMSLNNLAMLYKSQGQYIRAEPFYIEAVLINKETLGDKHPDYALCLNNLATLYQSQGLYAKAEPLYLVTLKIRKVALGEKHPDYSLSLNNLATLYDTQSLFAKAEPLYVEALRINKEVLGEKHPDYASSLNNLAMLYKSQGQYTKAEPFYVEALRIRKEVLGEKHPNYAISLNNLAELFYSQDQFGKAESLNLEALRIRKEVLGDKHPDYAISLNNLAMVYNSQGQSAKAEPLYIEAMRLNKEALGEKHPLYAGSMNNLAGLYHALGSYTKAEPLQQQAVEIVSTHLEKSSAYQSESDQLTNAKNTRGYIDNLLYGTRHSSASTTYELLFKLRGAVTARQYFARTARTTDPEVKKLLGEMKQLSQQISHWTNNPPKGTEVNITKTLEKFTTEFDQKQKELARQSNTFRKYEENKKLTPVDLQKKLPADAVLIDFLMFFDELTAFVITPKEIQRVNLGKLEPIAKAVDEFRQSLGRGHPLTGLTGDPALVLRDKLFTPLRKHTGEAKLWLISPDGPLCRLPFAALPGKDETKYLIEEVGVAVIAVPRLLFELLEEKPRNSPSSLITVGGVAFDSAPVQKDDPKPELRARAIGERNWSALEGTKGEANAIAALFTAKTKSPAMTLEGEKATKAAVRAAMERHAVFHFASHGFFADPKYTPKRTANTGLGSERITAGPNPNLLCGLVCAGANKPTQESDGILNALEIMDLDLTKVELAVLSACETGLGEVSGGEGVLGLQRALQLAGARTTVTSLWKVSDKATEALMVRFYRNRWEKGMGVLESMTEAQRWMLTEGVKEGLATRGGLELPRDPRGEGRTPPQFWAAFSLSGDWR